MRAGVRKWGNGLAIRIPKAIATKLRIEEKSFVEMRLEKGSVVVTPVRQDYTLEELLERVTDQNIHGEADTGAPVGEEPW